MLKRIPTSNPQIDITEHHATPRVHQFTELRYSDITKRKPKHSRKEEAPSSQITLCELKREETREVEISAEKRKTARTSLQYWIVLVHTARKATTETECLNPKWIVIAERVQANWIRRNRKNGVILRRLRRAFTELRCKSSGSKDSAREVASVKRVLAWRIGNSSYVQRMYG